MSKINNVYDLPVMFFDSIAYNIVLLVANVTLAVYLFYTDQFDYLLAILLAFAVCLCIWNIQALTKKDNKNE